MNAAHARPVLFDVGGVLVDSHPDPAHIASLFGDPSPEMTALVDQSMWARRDQYDAGLSDREFWDQVSGDCGYPQLSDRLLAELVSYDTMRMHDVNPESIALVEELSQTNVRLGILSNAPRVIAEEIKNTQWAQVFDLFVFSSEVGSCKPHRGIYRSALEVLNVDPADVLFIDDRRKNLRAAELLGMHGLLWEDARRARTALTELGYLS